MAASTTADGKRLELILIVVIRLKYSLQECIDPVRYRRGRHRATPPYSCSGREVTYGVRIGKAVPQHIGDPPRIRDRGQIGKDRRRRPRIDQRVVHALPRVEPGHDLAGFRRTDGLMKIDA